MKHSKLPWRTKDRGMYAVFDANNDLVCGGSTIDDAALIVRAVNNHSRLVEALKEIVDPKYYGNEAALRKTAKDALAEIEKEVKNKC